MSRAPRGLRSDAGHPSVWPALDNSPNFRPIDHKGPFNPPIA